MNSKEAKSILNRIINDPNIADQFTEDELKELESLANKK